MEMRLYFIRRWRGLSSLAGAPEIYVRRFLQALLSTSQLVVLNFQDLTFREIDFDALYHSGANTAVRARQLDLFPSPSWKSCSVNFPPSCRMSTINQLAIAYRRTCSCLPDGTSIHHRYTALPLSSGVFCVSKYLPSHDGDCTR